MDVDKVKNACPHCGGAAGEHSWNCARQISNKVVDLESRVADLERRVAAAERITIMHTPLGPNPERDAMLDAAQQKAMTDLVARIKRDCA